MLLEIDRLTQHLMKRLCILALLVRKQNMTAMMLHWPSRGDAASGRTRAKSGSDFNKSSKARRVPRLPVQTGAHVQLI